MPRFLQFVLLLAVIGLFIAILLKGVDLATKAWLRRVLRRRHQYSLDHLPPVLEPHRREILALARPCVRLQSVPLARGEADDPLRSKFGGVPFLSAADDWPRTQAGKPLAFVAQVNLEHVAAALRQAGREMPEELPRQGILQCFTGLWDWQGEAEPVETDLWRVRWVPQPGAPVPPASPPETSPQVEHRWLAPRAGWSLPDIGDEVTPPPAAARPEGPLQEACGALCMGVIGPDGAHQLLGYGFWFQGDDRTRQGVAGERLYDDPAAWRVLWQIEDDGVVDLGDAGVMYVLIRQEDLLAGRLDRVRAFNEQA